MKIVEPCPNCGASRMSKGETKLIVALLAAGGPVEKVRVCELIGYRHESINRFIKKRPSLYEVEAFPGSRSLVKLTARGRVIGQLLTGEDE